MRCLATQIAVLTFFMVLATVFRSSLGSQSALHEKIIFAVSPAEKGAVPDAPILEPVVILEGSQFKEPLNHDKMRELEGMSSEFEKTYFRPGQEYPMLFGGSENGTIVVEQPAVISCGSLTATVKTSAPIPNGQTALAATSVEGLGIHANWRRLSTSAERSAFLELAARFLRKLGLASVQAAAIKVNNLRATKLGSQGPDAIIGGVTFKGQTEIHHLFLVAVRKDAQFDVAVSSYHLTKDIEDSVDNVEENFVDQLDFDNDGVDEIITRSAYYESWDYAIYKEQQGKWQKVYQGAGGGC
jgi:hypothetical protein